MVASLAGQLVCPFKCKLQGASICKAARNRVLKIITMAWTCPVQTYLYMLPQHRAIGLQTDCMVVATIVPAPVVRLPDSHVYAPWPLATGCHPCNNSNDNNTNNAPLE